MGVGQVVSDTLRAVKSHFGQLLGLWAIYLGIMIAAAIVLTVVMGVVGLTGFAAMGQDAAPTEGSLLALGTGMVVLVGLFYLAYLLIAMAQYASMIIAASPLRQASLGDALGAGWRAAPALLLLMVVLLLCYIPLALVLSGVGAAASSLGDAGSAVLLLLVLPVLVWIGCRLAPLIAVVAVDGVRNPFSAIARSWRLTRGHALTIFLAWLAFIVILLVVAGVALLPSLGVLRSMSDPSAVADVGSALGGMALLFLGFMVISALFTMLYAGFQAVIHSSLSNASGEGMAEAFA